MAALVGPDPAETRLHLGTTCMDHVLGNVGPSLGQGSLQCSDRLVSLGAGPGLKNGSHREVHRIEVRAARRPHLLVPKVWESLLAKGLDNFGCVGGRSILLKDVRDSSIGLGEPGGHCLFQHGLVFPPVDPDTNVHKDEGQLFAIAHDPGPDHNRGWLHPPED